VLVPFHHFACFLLFLFSGSGSDGKAVFLRDIWPSREEIEVTCYSFFVFLLAARGLSLHHPEMATNFLTDITYNRCNGGQEISGHFSIFDSRKKQQRPKYFVSDFSSVSTYCH